MKIYLVGGAVRDKLLGLPIKERDWVVVGGTVADMLKKGYRQVGKEFPVFLHPETAEEYALARMERKVQLGYKGFTFDTSPDVSLENDLIRRDLTMNAMAFDPETGAIIDPYGGQADIEQKIFRHVSPAFSEDPVRILRVGRFLARYASFGFHVAPETIELMRKMVDAGEVNALVAERVWKELERALGEPQPEQFFAVLAQCHALPILFPHVIEDGPGLKAMQAVQPMELSELKIVRFAALLHAMPEEKTDKSEARKLIANLSNRYRVPNAYRELAQLVAQHAPKAFAMDELSDKDVIELFSAMDIYRRPDRWQHFVLTCRAIAKSTQKPFASEQLLALANCAKSYDVQQLLAQGLNGNELAIKLKEKRLEAITKFRGH